VFGAIERGGRVRAAVVPDSSAHSLAGPLREFVLPSANIFTDEWRAYDTIGLEFKSHRRIRHAESVYVSGEVHTQTIEGFWSTVKRGISGNYHSVSTKWLQGYLNEFVWRYNRRKLCGDRAMFHLLTQRAVDTALPWS
jgi:transposase